MITEVSRRKFLVVALFVTSLVAPAVSAKGRPVLSTSPRPCSQSAGSKKPDLFVRTELFFGSEREDDPDVTPEQFHHFLDKIVTPLFPDGLTLLTGRGQFCCDKGGAIIQETSFVLILLYPLDKQKESSEKIDRIRDDYKAAFKQQSVLRVDDPRPVFVSF